MQRRSLVSALGFALLLSAAMNDAGAVPASPVPLADGVPCPVTKPNGSTPPEETPDPVHQGNGKLWTIVGRKAMVVHPDDLSPNGSIHSKRPWWRQERGATLTIEGRRLDAPAPPLTADIPEGYDAWVQATVLDFPTVGCWEVTGHAGDASLTFVS